MEQNCVNGNGGGVGVQIQLPIGFRFRPTDEELLLHYLKPKVLSSPFPASVIPVLPHHIIFHSLPSHLPGDPEERRHFFCQRKWDSYMKNRSSSSSRRRIRITTCDGSGYWKAAIGKEKTIHIVAPGLSTPLVGIKKSFIFYQGKPPHGVKTPWIMHEYRLLPSQTTTHNSTHDDQELENWVVCSIYQRKRKSKNHGRSSSKTTRNSEKKVIKANSESVMDFIILDSTEFGTPLPPSPTCSSGIPDNIFLSNELLDQEEACSSNISFAPHFSCFREN